MSKIVIYGAASAIARETAKLFAVQGWELGLVARQTSKLEAIKQDLEVRGAKRVHLFSADLAETEGHTALMQEIESAMPEYDAVLVAYGSLPDQKLCQESYAAAAEALRVNFLSVVSLLTATANLFEARRNGTIAVITSVAGDRGRRSNYVYGTAKGALGIFLQGLRNRLDAAGVRVITIKPGFVDTPMTAGMKNCLLYTSPSPRDS